MTATIVATVLRSGGEYKPEHVARLHAQVIKHLPTARFVCLSDVDVPCTRIPLQYGWPGWWSKMELFRPDLRGRILFFDLDTTIVGDLKEIAAVSRRVIMRDVYRPHGLQSSMMMIPYADRAEVWRAWIQRPEIWMKRFARGGDQAFLETLWIEKASIWQDLLPGQVVSYKVHCRNGVPPDARVVIHHGRPRPWELEQ